MSGYIEREFALNVLCRENCGHNYEANKCNNCYTSNFINYLPAADVAEVKRGKWIEYLPVLRVGNLQIGCSECGLTNDFKTSYCPNCGAKMDLED